MFDVIQRKVLAGEQELHLTSREQSLLYFLAANPGTIFTREEILAALWGTEFAGDTRAVDRHIQAIRAKLGDDRHMPRYIETIPGAGYRFVCTSEVSDERHTELFRPQGHQVSRRSIVHGVTESSCAADPSCQSQV